MDFTEEQQNHINGLIAEAKRNERAKHMDRIAELEKQASDFETIKAAATERIAELEAAADGSTVRDALARGAGIVAGAEEMACERFRRIYQLQRDDDGALTGCTDAEGNKLTLAEAAEKFREAHPFLVAARGGAGVTRPSSGGAPEPDLSASELIEQGWAERTRA